MDGWREIIETLDRHPSFCIIVASLLSGFLSALIAGIFALFNSISRNKSEELRARSDVAVRIGMEAFKHTLEVSKNKAGPIGLMPPEFWILSSVKLAELLNEKNITAETAKKKIEEAIKFSEEVSKTIIEKSSQPVTPADRPKAGDG